MTALLDGGSHTLYPNRRNGHRLTTDQGAKLPLRGSFALAISAYAPNPLRVKLDLRPFSQVENSLNPNGSRPSDWPCT
jgi:hypothetical protein